MYRTEDRYIEEESIENEQLREFLDVCFSYADTFSLTKGYFVDAETEKMLDRLKPYLIKDIKTTHWFSYYVLPDNKKHVHIFRVCSESREIVTELYKSLFFGMGEGPLEDICFFKDKKLFIGTVSHESICFLYPINDEMALAFKGICDWEEVDDISAEQIVYD
ncbi:MAG: hypothetical protein K6E39_06240 [Lachnospiraceae bacterium]|nr:hypothetical protein [Lachnospiraceae bacterium]